MASDSHDDGYVPIAEDKLGPPDDWEDERGIYGLVSELEIEDLPKPIQKYLKDRVETRYSKRTHYNITSANKHWMAFCVERAESDWEDDVDVLYPTVVDMEDFIDAQLGAGYKQGTIENRVYDLSSTFRYLSKRGYSGPNPVEDENFEMNLETDGTFGDIRYIEKDEFEQLLKEVQSLRDRVLVLVLWDTGVRAQELVSIYMDDVDLEEQKITLKTAKQQGDREKDRVVYFTRRTRRALEEWMERGGRREYLGHESSPYLLLGKGTEKLNSRRPTELIREYAEQAGVQAQAPVANAAGHKRRKVTAHCFRHSFAVLRVKRGMPIVYLSDLLGHEDIQQTRVYLQFRDDDLKEAYDKYRP